MLTVRFVSDPTLLAPICASLDLTEGVSGANFVLYEGEAARGIMRTRFKGEKLCVEKIAFLEDVPADDREFFFRAMLFKFLEGAPITLRIEGVNEELLPFGFEETDGGMEIFTKNINLHFKCAEGRRPELRSPSGRQ